ncbi:MAG: thrombospondin type 3 repeat-containing protein [bacterium]
MRSFTRLTLSLLSFSLFAAACGDAETGDTQRIHRQEIMGGAVDSADTFAVGIFAAQGYAAGTCSGTLIAPNLVLTAQHCVAEVATDYVECGTTTFGTKTNPRNILVTTSTYLNRNARFYRAREVLTPADSNDMCGNDIALIILGDVIGPEEAIPAIPKIDEAPRRGDVYAAIGYGHIGDGTGSGVRRRIDNREVQCAGSGCPDYTSVQNTEFFGSDGTCQGDSGGTALDLDGRVFGALSRGPSGCAASIYSGVFEWGEWMREVGQKAADLGGYEPHFWVTRGFSKVPEYDVDFDGVSNNTDNCPEVENLDQADADGDGIGNVCDSDPDNDQIADDVDNCPLATNGDQADADGDGIGDACDTDADNDGINDSADNCPAVANADQADDDGNGIGNACQAAQDVTDTTDGATIVNGQSSSPSGGCSVGAGPTSLFALFALLGLRRRR